MSATDVNPRHLVFTSDHESGQKARVVCTCGEKFTGVLPGVAYEAWLAHRTEAVGEALDSTADRTEDEEAG